MSSRSRRVTAIAGSFYGVLIFGNGVLASWFAAVHEMPWVALGVGMLAVVALAATMRIIRTQHAADRDGLAPSVQDKAYKTMHTGAKRP